MDKRVILDIEAFDKIVVVKGKTLEDIVREYNLTNVLAALVNNEIQELNYEINEDSKIKFLTNRDRIGSLIYISGLKFIFITAVKELFGREVEVFLKHSIDKGIYCTIDEEIDNNKLLMIKNKMKSIISQDLKIKRITTTTKDAMKYFKELEDYEKYENYKLITNDTITLYSLLDYYNYFYTAMPISTGEIKDFDLSLSNDGAVILRYPEVKTGAINDYEYLPKVLDVFKDYSIWSNKLDVNYVSDVNRVVISGKIKEFIQLNEIKQNEELEKIASTIEMNIDKIKLICIAGPSSSGKTTTSKKLSLYLKSKGINPFVISLDNYFKRRVDTPKNENGEYLYDSIEAIDVELFNEDLIKLLNKEVVVLPEYNFITGEREYNHPGVSMENRDVLIIEGIHTLNEELTNKVNRENKIKIYVSPFTPLALDRHSHVSTVDLRFIRRLVRDYRTRGRSALASLETWGQVRDSEEKYVFPYQKEADIILNTALIYEIGMLKTYALPLLQSIRRTSEYYSESIRIINFLNNFLDIPVDILPDLSVLREFIGKGYFD